MSEIPECCFRLSRGIGATVNYVDEHTVRISGGTINPNSDLCVDDEFIRKNQGHPTTCLAHYSANTSTHRLLFQADVT